MCLIHFGQESYASIINKGFKFVFVCKISDLEEFEGPLLNRFEKRFIDVDFLENDVKFP